jgi:hypothetical protein
MALLLLLNGAAVAAAQNTSPKPSLPTLPKPTAATSTVAKQAPARQAPPQNGNCVGVVSQGAEEFTATKVGITAFGNEHDKFPVEAWHIDDFVVAKFNGYLGKRAAAVRIPFNKDAFASLDMPKLLRNFDADIGEIVRTITSGTRCARYVVVTTHLGVVGVHKTLISTGYFVCAQMVLRVYDGQTFSLVTSKIGPNQDSFRTICYGLYREVDESFWPVSAEAAVQSVKLRDTARELVAKGLDTTLPELKLTTE